MTFIQNTFTFKFIVIKIQLLAAKVMFTGKTIPSDFYVHLAESQEPTSHDLFS